MTYLTTTQYKTYITIDRPNSEQPPAHNHNDTYNPRRGNESWTVNKKRRRGEEEDGEQTETVETFRKFGINLGSFRTEADILAELHLKYP